MSPRTSSRSHPPGRVELVIGRGWRTEASLLRRLPAEGRSALEHLVDTVDLVVDGCNLTRHIAAERPLELLAGLLEALVALGTGRRRSSPVRSSPGRSRCAPLLTTASR